MLLLDILLDHSLALSVLTKEDFIASLRALFYRAKLLLAGDLNTNLEYPEGTPQLEENVDEVAAARFRIWACTSSQGSSFG